MQKLRPVKHRPKINAVFDVIVGIRNRNTANYEPEVGMILVKFDFLRSISLERTVSASMFTQGFNAKTRMKSRCSAQTLAGQQMRI
ncbi:MAG: hypothetical protein A2Z14_16845 [Chloroflexi bacterium RBG_16_48_8]|nr:MAG: hypothetical protein A2Z14_16845 [Chloroflexi bacterium RBG_16_48_8]